VERNVPGVIEIMRFRLKEGVDESDFQRADARLQVEFAYQQPGLQRRTTARSEDGEWLVIDLWRSPADSDACLERWHDSEVVEEFMTYVDRQTVATARYQQLEG
jgi:hypothetical protein